MVLQSLAVCTTLYQKNLPSIAWLALCLSCQWLAGDLFPSCLRDTSIAINRLPSGTAALFERGFFPHYTFPVGFSTPLLSLQHSLCRNTTWRRLVQHLLCLLNVADKWSTEDYKNMVLLPHKGPYKEPLPSTSSFPQVDLPASLFIQERTALQTCHSLAAELTLVLIYWVRKIV